MPLFSVMEVGHVLSFFLMEVGHAPVLCDGGRSCPCSLFFEVTHAPVLCDGGRSCPCSLFCC